MKRLLMISLLVLSACSSGSVDEEETTGQNGNEANPSPENAKQPSSDSFQSEAVTVASSLKVPWDIEFAGESLLISERPGSIVEVTNEETTRKSVQLENNLADQPEAGLLGIAVPSSYSEDGQIAAYYTYRSNEGIFQRVVILEETGEEWVEARTLLDKIPGGTYHQGGRLEIGPDDLLYVTTGDATEPELAQDLDNLAGKILRINMDGSIPESNPFENSPVYSYGHRNPQGLAWNDEGELYATEHGNQAHDEINKIEAGNNYGWPVIEGSESQEGMKTPLTHSGSDSTWAPSGMAYADGNFYFGSLRGQAVRRFQPENNSVSILKDGYGRIRDVAVSEKGLYFITNNKDGRGSPEPEDDRLILLPE